MIQAKIAHFTSMPAQVFGAEAPGTSIRVLINDEHDGAPVYNMRMIEIEPGGHSPLHQHPYEHENYVLNGEGEVFIDGKTSPIAPGTVILVPPGVMHQYRNTGTRLLRFLCSVPVAKLRQG